MLTVYKKYYIETAIYQCLEKHVTAISRNTLTPRPGNKCGQRLSCSTVVPKNTR